jgi:hypothetical protein
MLDNSEVMKIKDVLVSCKRPFFYFHDDPDGLASFLLFYRFVREGKGFAVKAHPHITGDFVRRVIDYSPDHVFVLDIALMDQEFVDAMRVPVSWIDHHPPQHIENASYYNPRLKESSMNIPTPVLCYQVVNQDLWIATVGAIGDWYFPDFAAEFSKQFPDILPDSVKTVQDAMFRSPIGVLIKAFSFALKGPSSNVSKCIRALCKINSPYEILRQETGPGKFVFRQFERINNEYERLKKDAIASVDPKDSIAVFLYRDDRLSLTKDLANEMIALYPDKIIVLGRERDDEYRCSLRSGPSVDLSRLLEKAFKGVQGRGGGHEHACGAVIKKVDFSKFLNNLRELR